MIHVVQHDRQGICFDQLIQEFFTAAARCCLRQDNTETGPSSGWQVKDVRIEDDETDRVWVFVFDRWLGLEESGTLRACVDG